jgi:hypothetical protein
VFWSLFRTRPARRPVRSTYRPNLEQLEDRAVPATFIVSNFSDTLGATGTLRDAIERANNNPGADAIVFGISPFGLTSVQTIQLRAKLVIRDTVSMNGSLSSFAFPGFPPPRPGVEIIAAPTNSSSSDDDIALEVRANGCNIRGLIINRSDQRGMIITGNGNTVRNSFIGTTADGKADAGTQGIGILVFGNNNIIGGPNAGDRNVISGNASGVVINGGAGQGTGNRIEGNLIGGDVNGSLAIPNFTGIILNGNANNTLVVNNVISGNTQKGIALLDPTVANNVIRGNKIGVAIDGVTARGNGLDGIYMEDGAHNNTVGGTNTGDGNIIAFNGRTGVLIGRDPNSTIPLAGVGNSVLGNLIFASPFQIDLGPGDLRTATDSFDADTGPNNLQNHPLFIGAGPSNNTTLVSMDISAVVGRSYRIELYHANTLLNGAPQDLSFISATNITVTTAPDFVFNINVPTFPVDTAILVTATDLTTGDTSEFNAVAIANTPPMIRDDALTLEINEGQEATLSGRLVDPDPGDKLALIVNWGDGTPVQTFHPGLKPFAFKHRYVDDGIFNVQFTWIDNHGGSNTRTRQVVVHNVEPDLESLRILPNPATRRHVLLQGVVTDPGVNDKIKITWTLAKTDVQEGASGLKRQLLTLLFS